MEDAMQNTMTRKKSGGCGCGGEGGGSNGKCSCARECETCSTETLVRPRFFSGQLLTDEDLQALNEYVLAKNRLQNRYLVGPGVVCGLLVNCDPCGGGKVTVQPGYAIDCCGNDIVLACDHHLD